MSFAVRNTIILLVTLFLIGGGAFGYIYFFQEREMAELQSTHAEKQNNYTTKRAISDAYPELNERYQKANAVIEGYDKTLFESNNPDDVYDYLIYISNSRNSKIFFEYNFTDSTIHDQYGIIRSDIRGYSSYTNFINFINKLENSRLLNKVVNLSLVPPGGEELSDITFSFTLDTYYERIPIQESNNLDTQLRLNENISAYNSFYPLIQRSLPPNEGNLINVEQSRVIGLTVSRIFIIDQNGNIHSLKKGDEVYLGQLQNIDPSAKTATFKLNKGGITESVTLEIEQ